MDLDKLREILIKQNIPKSVYSIMPKGLPNEKLCIVKEECWKVFYSEHGRRTGEKRFSTENDACRFFWEALQASQKNSLIELRSPTKKT